MTTTPTTLTHTYRTFYRHALRAVHYSTPARYQIRDILRESFRDPSPTSPSPSSQHLANTLRFLSRAAVSNGTEHKILRNILHARFWTWQATSGIRFRSRDRPGPWMSENTDVAVELRGRRGAQLRATVELLNRSMGLCLRT